MKLDAVADTLWGKQAKVSYLLFAAAFSLFTLLGAHEIWTQEHRWADIVVGMFYRHDFLHPYLGNSNYYDKPLLSYWLIAGLSFLTNAVTTWTLRLPSALAGLLAVWSIYKLGTKLKDKELGLLAGWLLLTTYYFIFWARTSSADMMNMAGSLFAVAWYVDKRDHAGFSDYAIFFMVLALTSLCKGLVGAIVPLIAVTMDMGLNKTWKQHVRLPLFLAILPALLIYFAPFIASSHFGSATFHQSGLYLVYRENVLRYFKPFDHQGPIYTYFIYLPVYLLPWAVFFIPALFSLKSRWHTLTVNSKWIVWTLAALFLFFTLSGSRRSYYVLPMIPFALLMTADWILSGASRPVRKQLWTAGCAVLSFVFLYMAVDVFPAWYYSRFGAQKFVTTLQNEANKIKPWKAWNVVVLDGESKLYFYLGLPPTVEKLHIKGETRHQYITEAQLLAAWPMLKHRSDDTIYISRKLYAPILKNILADYRQVEIPLSNVPFGDEKHEDAPVGYIPHE